MRKRLALEATALAIALWLALGAAGAGCAPVRPWERTFLSQRSMIYGVNKLELKFDKHVRETREAATGGGGGYGGGCGCN